MSLADYLNMMADSAPARPDFLYPSYESLVLKYGTLYTGGRLEVSGRIKECYINAYYAARDNGWTYVEGYASSIIPVGHAWCLDGDGVVVETTWPEVGSEYYGVPLRPEWVLAQAMKTKHWGVLPNDWMRDCVLLRGGFPPEATPPA
jgi:hypothetical protein